MSTFIFLWLQNQTFYKLLQQSVLRPIRSEKTDDKSWADVGCSTGLLSREAAKKGYSVVGYDINRFSLFFAKVLSWHLKNISYSSENFETLQSRFDVVSATSLLSVVDDKKETLEKLVRLLKTEKSILIIIEPTELLSTQNVKKLIVDFKTLWYYKGLLLWAKARENKSVDIQIFDTIKNIDVKHEFYLNEMVRVSYISYS